MVTITPITIPTSPDLLGSNSNARVIATGENSIYLYGMTGYLIKIDLLGKTVTYSNSLINAFPDTYLGPIYKPHIDRNGNIRTILFYTKTSETVDSRYLYEQEITIDPDTLDVQLGTERQYENNVINNGIFPWTTFLPFSENVLFAPHDTDKTAIIIDMYKKRVVKTSQLITTGNYIIPLSKVLDVTSNKPSILIGTDYFNMTYGTGVIYTLNPYDFSQIMYSGSYASGAGPFAWKKYYMDSQGTVRLIIYGAGIPYSGWDYITVWHALYFDNTYVREEFYVVPDLNYMTSDPGSIHPNVIGVRSSDNRLILAMYGYPNTQCSTWGVSVVDTNDKLQNPANLVESTVPISTDESAGYLVSPYMMFLDENTYDVLAYGGVITYDNQPTMFLFDIGDLPDMHYDPFNLIPISKSGMTPTTLELNAIPL
jgi:hypothetical protein